MKTICPHCKVQIEIDPETHATLQGHAHFQCPSCSGLVPVPPITRAPVKVSAAAAIRPAIPSRTPVASSIPASAHRGMNRNFLILGSVTLLVLGGLGFFLASKKSGDTHKTTQNIRNEIINNTYFQNLISSGATTRNDLEAMASIQAYGDGFIGISKEPLDWGGAQAMAEKAGAEILGVGDKTSGSRQQLLGWLATSFSAQLSAPAWVRERSEARVLDGSDVLTVTSIDRPRYALFQWGLPIGDGVFYPGGDGPGKGKRVVLLAGDEEYRSEESLPMLAKLLSQRHGFKCTVVFSINKQTGEIDPNTKDHQPGIEALGSADLCIIALRYRNWPDEQMKHFADYVAAGKPIIAIRTSTHAFNGIQGKYASFNNFGKEVLGEGWVNHWGKHKFEATRVVIEEAAKGDPLLRGVSSIFGDSDVYEVSPSADAKILARGLVLKGMNPDDAPADYVKTGANKQQQPVNSPAMPILWTRVYGGSLGNSNQVLCTTMGAATDFESEGLRRVIVNAAYAFTGLEVPTMADATPTGDYNPSKYQFDGFIRGMKPADHSLRK